MHEQTRHSTFPRPATAVWAVLMLATVASWAIGTRHGADEDIRRLATVVVLAVAFGKVYLVGTHFMELRRSPLVLKALFISWVLGVSATVIAIYLIRG